MEVILVFFVFFVLITLGYFAGTYAESKHYQSILVREQALLHLPAITGKNLVDEYTIAEARLVTGSVVVSIDYFKRFVAILKSIFGGNIRSYETLIDRARREATLRMKEMAKGADMILNIRLETCSIGGGTANDRNSIGSVEVLAYGTAIKLKK